jgi:hypothetical protein
VEMEWKATVSRIPIILPTINPRCQAVDRLSHLLDSTECYRKRKVLRIDFKKNGISDTWDS